MKVDTCLTRAPHEHGNRSHYATCGCTCPVCRAGVSAYFREYRARAGKGTMVDAGPVAVHVARLRVRGATWQAIADLAGVPEGTVRRVRIRKWVHVRTARRILAIR